MFYKIERSQQNKTKQSKEAAEQAWMEKKKKLGETAESFIQIFLGCPNAILHPYLLKIDFKPELSFKQLIACAKQLETIGLSVKINKPESHFDGLMIIPGSLTLNDSLESLVNKFHAYCSLKKEFP